MWYEAIRQVAEAADKAQTISPGDYMRDGLLYCGKCHTQKQVVVHVGGKSIVMSCVCECEIERMQQSDAATRKDAHEIRLAQLRQEMGFPAEDLRGCSFDQDDRDNAELSRLALRYVEQFGDLKNEYPSGLLLFGNTGGGKTYMATCIVNALNEKGYTCIATNFLRLCNIIGSMRENKQKYIDSLNVFDLLVIDDLGAEWQGEYNKSTVYNIIDSRYRAGKPIIVTTNLSGNELKNATDVQCRRIYSRLLEMCFPFEVKHSDRRRSILGREHTRMHDLLLGEEKGT